MKQFRGYFQLVRDFKFRIRNKKKKKKMSFRITRFKYPPPLVKKQKYGGGGGVFKPNRTVT